MKGHSFGPPPFFVKSPDLRATSKPNKTNHYHRKKIPSALPGITSQKPTIKAVVRRADFMQDAIRKAVPVVRESLEATETPKCAIKVHKSAQKTPGNQPATPLISTIYEEFPAKNTPPPLFRQRRS
jgi:hypothetical protein